MYKNNFILFFLIAIQQISFAQIQSGTYYSYISDSTNVSTEMKMIFNAKDSVKVQLYVYNDQYLFDGIYHIEKNKLFVKYYSAKIEMAKNEYNFDKNENKDSILNLKINLQNNTRGDNATIEDVKVSCKKHNNEKALIKIKPKFEGNIIYLDIPLSYLPFDVYVSSKNNRESVIQVNKNFDFDYTLYLAHNVRILKENTTVFKTPIKNINDYSFELKINRQPVLMNLMK